MVARDGYEAASVDRIAEEAGFSKGAFYSNFTSKEEIFIELLEAHASTDVVELTTLLKDVEDPQKVIDIISGWAVERSSDRTMGLLALELFRRAQRDETFGKRHMELFHAQWEGLGQLLMRMFPKDSLPMSAEILGAVVCELTYGSSSGYTSGEKVGEMVRTTLTALFLAYGKR